MEMKGYKCSVCEFKGSKEEVRYHLATKHAGKLAGFAPNYD